jgi:hypothetical protein
MAWSKLVSPTTQEALHDAFASFDSLNAGIFTLLGTVIGFYFGKTSDAG